MNARYKGDAWRYYDPCPYSRNTSYWRDLKVFVRDFSARHVERHPSQLFLDRDNYHVIPQCYNRDRHRYSSYSPYGSSPYTERRRNSFFNWREPDREIESKPRRKKWRRYFDPPPMTLKAWRMAEALGVAPMERQEFFERCIKRSLDSDQDLHHRKNDSKVCDCTVKQEPGCSRKFDNRRSSEQIFEGIVKHDPDSDRELNHCNKCNEPDSSEKPKHCNWGKEFFSSFGRRNPDSNQNPCRRCKLSSPILEVTIKTDPDSISSPFDQNLRVGETKRTKVMDKEKEKWKEMHIKKEYDDAPQENELHGSGNTTPQLLQVPAAVSTWGGVPWGPAPAQLPEAWPAVAAAGPLYGTWTGAGTAQAAWGGAWGWTGEGYAQLTYPDTGQPLGVPSVARLAREVAEELINDLDPQAHVLQDPHRWASRVGQEVTRRVSTAGCEEAKALVAREVAEAVLRYSLSAATGEGGVTADAEAQAAAAEQVQRIVDADDYDAAAAAAAAYDPAAEAGGLVGEAADAAAAVAFGGAEGLVGAAAHQAVTSAFGGAEALVDEAVKAVAPPIDAFHAPPPTPHPTSAERKHRETPPALGGLLQEVLAAVGAVGSRGAQAAEALRADAHGVLDAAVDVMATASEVVQRALAPDPGEEADPLLMKAESINSRLFDVLLGEDFCPGDDNMLLAYSALLAQELLKAVDRERPGGKVQDLEEAAQMFSLADIEVPEGVDACVAQRARQLMDGAFNVAREVQTAAWDVAFKYGVRTALPPHYLGYPPGDVAGLPPRPPKTESAERAAAAAAAEAAEEEKERQKRPKRKRDRQPCQLYREYLEREAQRDGVYRQPTEYPPAQPGDDPSYYYPGFTGAHV